VLFEEFYLILKYLVSLAFADMIILSSLSGLTLVFNTVFAVFFQKEILTKYDMVCIITTLMGASFCVIFSNY
jgi:hypothetical protein